MTTEPNALRMPTSLKETLADSTVRLKTSAPVLGSGDITFQRVGPLVVLSCEIWLGSPMPTRQPRCETAEPWTSGAP